MMKTAHHPALLAFALLICFVSNSQATYRPGYVVSISGDTISGWIEYRRWDNNPKNINFKKDLKYSQVETYMINEIAFFEVSGKDRYTRAIVKKDMRPVALSQLSNSADTLVTDTVFLRNLVEGKISLFQYSDSKVHFYIKEREKDYQELIYKVYLRDGQLVKAYTFRDQLRYFFPKSYDLYALPALIRTAKYTETDLVKLLVKINKSEMGGQIRYRAGKLKQRPSFYAGAGLVSASLFCNGPYNEDANLSYRGSFQPFVVAGVDLPLSRNLRKLTLRVELAGYSSNYSGTNWYLLSRSPDSINYHLKIYTLAPTLYLKYNVLNYIRHKIYFSAGIASNISAYPENTLYRWRDNATVAEKRSPFLDFKELWFGFNAKAGYIFNKKIEIAVTRSLGGTFAKFSTFSLDPELMAVNLSYHF